MQLNAGVASTMRR